MVLSSLRFAALLLPILAFACTPGPYRIGVKAAEDGRFVEATASWLQALDEDIYASKPRKALRETSLQAWEQFLDEAREHEASERYEESVATYDRALIYSKALDEVELLSFSTADAIAEREDVLNMWALSERARGMVAHQTGKWEEAATHFDRARELLGKMVEPVRGTGLDAEEGLTYAAWAKQDLQEHHYHDAADHFRRAYELSGDREMDAWAVSVEAGLGRYALSKGACRSAVEHFEKAGDVVGDPDLPADLLRALDCSRLGLLLDPVDDAIRHSDGDLALGAMLLDRIERDIGEDGSRYIRILNADVLSSIQDPPDDQVRVSITVSQASVTDPVVTETKKIVEGMRVVECDAQTLLYAPDEVCTEAVEVEYKLHRTAQTARLSGAVKTVDLRSGEQTTTPLDVQMTHDSTHASDFQLFEAGTTVDIQIGTKASVGRIELPEAIVVLNRQPRPLPSANEMLVDSVRALASEAARAILMAVDKETEPPEPRSLTLIRPVLGATDMDFRVVQPPEAMEPRIESTPLLPVDSEESAPPIELPE